MGERRSAAIIIAALAAVLVMLAGRSCAENMKRSREDEAARRSATNTVATGRNDVAPTSPAGTQTYTVTNPQQPGVEYVTDILGRIIGTIENTDSATEPDSEPQVEYVTDILGRVIRVIEPETVPVTEDPTAATVKKNPLEEYQEKYSTSPPKRDSDIESEHYTAPSTLQITIG